MAILIMLGMLLVFGLLSFIMHMCWKKGMKTVEHKQQVCTEQTTAVVREMRETRIRVSDDYNYTWYPVYEYYAYGYNYVQKSDFGTNQDTFQVGQQVVLFYNPGNPQEIYVPEENSASGFKIFQVMSWVLFGACIFIVILFVVLMSMGII